MDDELEGKAPQAWVDALARSEADLAAGRVVSGDGLMAQLRASIAEMKAERAEAEPHEASGSTRSTAAPPSSRSTTCADTTAC